MLALALAAGGGGCANATADSGATDLPSATGGAPPVEQMSLQFQDTPIQVLPREEQRVTVKVTPPGAYTVRFALLGAENGAMPVDAALDRSEIISDASGLARVVLTAPSTAGSFLLRAQVGTVSTTTSVTVVPGALLNLDVVPNYTGHRQITEWIASVHVGVGCNEFTDGVIPDSALRVRGASGAALRLEDVPAADKLAVTLRAGALAHGCTTVEQPAPDEDTEVVVTVNDQSIDLSHTVLQVSLGIDAKDASFTAELDAALLSIQDALLDGAANNVVAVLNDMEASFSNGAAGKFALARSEATWDVALLAALGRGAETRLSDAVLRYSRTGRLPLFSPLAFEGRLTGNSSSAVPSLDLQRAGGVAVAEIGLNAEARSWSVDSSDTLAFSAAIDWAPSALLAALSVAPASAETGALDVPGALAKVLSCTKVAASLAGDTTDAVTAFVTACPATCLEAVCEDALIRMWDRARLASGDSRTEMSVLATGAATVGPERQAIALDGTWVGRLTRELLVSQSGGALKGYEPR